MGARASVQIINSKFNEKSVVLCQHWGGEEFHDEVTELVSGLWSSGEVEKETNKVEDRWEPNRLIIKVISRLGEGGYVEPDRSEVDDSDYGCLVVDLADGKPSFEVQE